MAGMYFGARGEGRACGNTRTVGNGSNSGSKRHTGWALLAAAFFALPLHAQVQRTYVNPGFESPALTPPGGAGCYAIISEALIPGWTTTHPSGAPIGDCTAPVGPNGPLMELWLTGFNGVPARSGQNFAELNASASSRLYQNVCLVNGDPIAWRFSHRGRGSATVPDVMDYNIGASVPIVRVSTTSNGTVPAGTPVVSQGTANAPAAAVNGWRDYSGTFVYGGASGITSMGFESISTGSGSNTIGNFLDNIEILLKPFVEFVQPSSSTPESASSNVPTLRVNGTVFASFDVIVTISGGTATLGTDYTTPGNASTFTVTIPGSPQGIVYDGISAASLFPLPVTVVQDVLVESNETIQFQIQAPGGAVPPFLLRSSATCGGTAQTLWTYTIVDDDARLSVTKNAAAPVAVAGQPTQFDVAYTIAVTNTTPVLSANYSLVDTPGLDPDASIVAAGYTLNGGASTALTGSGPWTLQPQWRALAAGATDTYVLTVRINIARGGSTANDTCPSPNASGAGLQNNATATVQATVGANPTFSATACRNTPTPVWATLTKAVTARAQAADQFQIRTLSAGTVAATAVTAGAAVSATTGTVVLPASNTLQFDEALAAGGVPANYASSIACTNAASGSATALPSGPGTDAGARRQWAEFTPAAGDDITCTITNAPAPVDLSIAKTNNTTALVAGAPTTYVLTVSNNSASTSVTGAVVRDIPGAGLACPAANPVACAGPAGACPGTGLTVGTLTTAPGLVLGTLPAGTSLTLQYVCNVL